MNKDFIDKKLMAESSIERESRSLITRASNSSLVTTSNLEIRPFISPCSGNPFRSQ